MGYHNESAFVAQLHLDLLMLIDLLVLGILKNPTVVVKAIIDK